MIKGRSKGGPQEERGRKRKGTKEINGVDAEDRRMRISTITISRRVIDNKQTKRDMCSPHSEGKRYYLIGKRKIDKYLKSDIDRPTG